MREWFVVRTQRNREAWAAENILRQFAEPYAPRYAEKVKVGGHFELKPRLLFPSYIFVKTIDGRWRFLLGTYGVASVLLNNGAPATIPHAEILKLKRNEDASGMIILPKLGEGGSRFKRGTPVRVNEGAYSGYVGIYEGCGPKDRERILLDYLGRKTTVLLNAEFLTQV